MDSPLFAGRNERARRHMVNFLAAVSALAHAATLLAHQAPGSDPAFWLGLTGLLLSVGALLVRPRPETVLLLGLGVMASWLLLDVWRSVALGQGLTLWSVLDALVMVLLFFAALPERPAGRASLVIYAVLVVAGVLSGPVDWLAVVIIGAIVGLINFIALHGHAVSHARGQAEEMRWWAEHDGLTGLLNRRAMSARLGDQMLTPGGALLFLDLDNFKLLNDVLGHQAGDEALVEFSQFLRQATAGKGVIARWGGDEFMLLMPEASSDEAREMADRIYRGMAQRITPRYMGLTVSCGVSSLSDHTSLKELIAEADRHMYRDKSLRRETTLVTTS